MTSWEYPTSHGDVASPVAAPKKKISIQARAQWRKILDYARREATSKLQSKSKRFLGLRKFAEQAAKRKAEAADRKRKEKEEEEAANAAAAADALRPKKSIMEMLDVDTPPIEKQNIEEFADASFNLNRKGFFGKKTTVAKVLSWKNELIRTSCVSPPAPVPLGGAFADRRPPYRPHFPSPPARPPARPSVRAGCCACRPRSSRRRP